MSVNEVKLAKAKKEFEVMGTGNPGSRTFALGNQDHTLGNSLRHVLMNNASVGFAGYSVPHPSEPVVHIRVQTIPSRSSEDDCEQKTALEALKEAAVTLSKQCDFILEDLERKLPELKQDRIEIEKFKDEYLNMEEYDEEDGAAEGAEDGGDDGDYDIEEY